jgi:hypothetical protein
MKPTNIIQRLFCVTISPEPSEPGCWSLSGDQLVLELARVPELQSRGRSLRLEGDKLPDRILVIHAEDGTFHAFRNRCACGGFRIDPVPGQAEVRCCTPMQSTYDFTGKPTGPHPNKDVDVLAVSISEDLLTIDISPLHQPAPHAR